MSLQATPRADRVHIAVFGLRNSGKSSLVNGITGQNISIVSDVPGTTTDPVYKSMEIHGIGPCVFIDTAGFDDVGGIGKLRIGQTQKIVDKTDIGILVFDGTLLMSRSNLLADPLSEQENHWLNALKKKRIPVIGVLNKTDLYHSKAAQVAGAIEKACNIPVIPVSTITRQGIDSLREQLIRSLPADFESDSITENLVKEGDVVLLVMPQDIQAPKGRLILPQVQVIRELLDKKCIVQCVTADKLEDGLAALAHPPKLIITDSQVFRRVYDNKPAESMLTSFSVLLAGYKGDLKYFAESACAIERLTENSRVLIAEACTHAPLEEDVGRVKIPAMLRKRVGQGLKVDIVAGADFPADLSGYDLIIHCGACMFNRKHVLSRVEKARAAGVPMTNYGVTIAYLSGILDKISMTV
ncbi:MAG: [FeFe] hydrogenase H-cluster maturation GTPase HydF [Caldicoprobacterales bacterium]|jgi:[FeFe] hydrogenase H-cluster maturation GTPase HydF